MDTEAVDTTETRTEGIVSRRAMFAAAVGSLAGWIGAAILRAAPAQAADGDPVTAGQTTDATSETVLRGPGATASTDNALKVRG